MHILYLEGGIPCFQSIDLKLVRLLCLWKAVSVFSDAGFFWPV